MKSFLEHMPMSVSGVALACAGLGILLHSFYGWAWAWVLGGGVASVLLALVFARAFLWPHSVRRETEVAHAVAITATVPMTIVEISTYLTWLAPTTAFVIWVVGATLNVAILGFFFYRALQARSLSAVTPAYLVGIFSIVLSGITASIEGWPVPGRLLSIYGMAMLLPAYGLVIARYLRAGNLDVPHRPLICIFAAPFGMVTTCYLSTAAQPSPALALALWAIDLGFWTMALVFAARYIGGRFSPAFAGMTFPFVISAFATVRLAGSGLVAGAAWLEVVAQVQMAIAAALTFAVLVRYLWHYARPVPAKE